MSLPACMPDSEPACLALRLPLALLGLACAWQINHKMALWFNATSAPPDPVNSAASVPETPGPPAPAAKKQKTQAKAGRPSNLTAFNKKNADMIGRGDITRYLGSESARSRLKCWESRHSRVPQLLGCK